MTPDEREDAYSDGIELRAAPADTPGPGTLAGYAIKWDTLSEPLVDTRSGQGFTETFRPGAFDKSLDGADVLAVTDHREGASNVFGRTPDTLKLTPDAVGLRFENALPDTTDGRDLARKVARGDIRGVSVGFKPAKGGVDWIETRGALPTRVISAARIVHLSYEPRPAYRDTTVALRSLEEARAAEVEVPPAAEAEAPAEPTPTATPEPQPSRPLSLAKARQRQAEAGT